MPSFNQANGSVTQQGLTDGQLTSHLCGGLTPAGLQTEGVGAEPGINQSAPTCYNINNWNKCVMDS